MYIFQFDNLDSKYFSFIFRTTQKERIEQEKAKAAIPAVPTPAAAAVSNPELSTPTTAKATPMPSLSTPSSVNPSSITMPASK